MKHLLRGFFIAVLFICCNFQLVLAQPMQTLPVDKNVRIGKLDNGLTYYIRHNALPEKRRISLLYRKWVPSLKSRNSAVWLTSLSTWLSTEQRTSRVMKPDWASCLGVKPKVSSSEQT